MALVTVFGALLSVIALLISWWTLKLARDSLAIAKRTVEHARMDWAQEKWFDLYLKAGRAYNGLEHYQALYQGGNGAVQSPEQLKEFNQLMRLFYEAHTMALVFPKNAATEALFASTRFKNAADALSKEKTKALLDALELLRQKALVDKRALEAGS